MSEPKEEKLLFQVKLIDGKLDLVIGDNVSFSMLTYAAKLLDLQIENLIIGNQKPKSKIVMPKGIRDILERG